MGFRKRLCDQCNLDGDCCCQKTQAKVDDCGMESVISYNENYNRCLKAGRTERDHETGEFAYQGE